MIGIVSFVLAFSMMTPAQDTPHPVGKERAAEIARAAVAALSKEHDFVIMDDKTVERPFGWVFFYAARRYVQTGDRQYLVPGTAPLVVNRADGSTEYLATSIPPARAIDIYEKRWREAQAHKQEAR